MVCFGCCRPSTSSSAHGGRAIAFVFGLIGLYCSYIVTQSCDFLHYRLLEDNDNRTASVEELPFPFHNVPITADGNGGDDNFGGHVGLYGYRDTTTTSSSSFASEAEKDDNTTTASTKTDGDKEDNKNASSSNKWEDFISVLPWNLDHTVCTRYEKQFFKLVNGGGEDESTNAKDANDSTSDADKDNTKLWFVVGSQLAQVGAIITTFVALLTLLLDWCAYTNCCSYTINWILFLFSCLLQSTTFIIYAQKELWYVFGTL